MMVDTLAWSLASTLQSASATLMLIGIVTWPGLPLGPSSTRPAKPYFTVTGRHRSGTRGKACDLAAVHDGLGVADLAAGVDGQEPVAPSHHLRTMQTVAGRSRFHPRSVRLRLVEHPVLARRERRQRLVARRTGWTCWRRHKPIAGAARAASSPPGNTARAKERKNASICPRPQLDTPGRLICRGARPAKA